MTKKIGLIGCGNWGKYILRDLVALGCEVSVVARSENALQNAVQYQAKAVFDSVEHLPIQDGYVVCTTSVTHYEIIQELTAKNPKTPIFVEKPLCTSVLEAQQLSQKLPDTLFVMDKWRYHTGILALKDLIQSEKYGKVIHISTKRLSRGTIHPDADTIWHLAPHDIAIAYELLGYLPEPAFARLDITHHEIRGMTACLGHSPCVWIEVGDRHHKHFREVKVFFENAIVTLSDAYSEQLEIYNTQQLEHNQIPVYEYLPFEIRMPLFDELAAFVEFLGGGPAPKSSVSEGKMIVETIEKLKTLAQRQ